MQFRLLYEAYQSDPASFRALVNTDPEKLAAVTAHALQLPKAEEPPNLGELHDRRFFCGKVGTSTPMRRLRAEYRAMRRDAVRSTLSEIAKVSKCSVEDLPEDIIETYTEHALEGLPSLREFARKTERLEELNKAHRNANKRSVGKSKPWNKAKWRKNAERKNRQSKPKKVSQE